MFRAVLDTCTLVPSLQRDFLLQLATEGSFAPLWGTGILTELDYTLARLHEQRGISDSVQRRHHLLAAMKHAFPGSEVTAPKNCSYDYGINDPDDGHVVHAALIGKADAIVTDDKRAGFRTAEALIEASIETVVASTFVANTVAAHPQAGVRALVALSTRRRIARQTPAQILDALVTRYRVDDAATILRPLLAQRMQSGIPRP